MLHPWPCRLLGEARWGVLPIKRVTRPGTRYRRRRVSFAVVARAQLNGAYPGTLSSVIRGHVNTPTCVVAPAFGDGAARGVAVRSGESGEELFDGVGARRGTVLAIHRPRQLLGPAADVGFVEDPSYRAGHPPGGAYMKADAEPFGLAGVPYLVEQLGVDDGRQPCAEPAPGRLRASAAGSTS